MDNSEEKKILQKVATLIAESLKGKGRLPSGESLRKGINDFAEKNKFKKRKFTPADVSRLKTLASRDLVDFSGVYVKGGLNEELGTKLENEFGLAKALIYNNDDIIASALPLNDYLGNKAAEYLKQDFHGKRIPFHLKENAQSFFEEQLEKSHNRANGKKIITFSCGSSVNAAIDHLSGEFGNTTVYSSIILFTETFEGLSPSKLIHNFSNKFKGSEGVAFQIPKRILEELSPNIDHFHKRKSIYNSIIRPYLSSTLNSDYFMLGIGGIPDDKMLGGFSFHVSAHAKKQGFRQELSNICCGEASFWPILKKNSTCESIWLWDYLIKKQKMHEREKKEKGKDDADEDYVLERQSNIFIDYFLQTYTIEFNKLRTLKQLSHEAVEKINGLANDQPGNFYEELQILSQDKKYKEIFALNSSNFEEIKLNIIDSLNKRKVIIPAGGDEKAEAIYQCLKTKWIIDVLVTDSNTANKVLELHGETN